MSKFGVNVPPGIPVFSLGEIDEAAKKMESPDGQVGIDKFHTLRAVCVTKLYHISK